MRLLGQHPGRLLALKARVLVERGVGRGAHLRLIGRLRVVFFASPGRPQGDEGGGVCVHQQEVVVRRCFRLAALLLLVLGGSGRALATALGAVHGHIGGALERQGPGGHPARSAFWRHAESGSRVRQNGHTGCIQAGVGGWLRWHGQPCMVWQGCGGGKTSRKSSVSSMGGKAPVAPPPARRWCGLPSAVFSDGYRKHRRWQTP